jgi:hypothetical protein
MDRPEVRQLPNKLENLMNTYHVETSAVIDAPAGRIYELISDYHSGHPSILPARYFSDLQVTKGGRGEGTEITVKMNVMGVSQVYQMTVSEPEPGRVLQEEDTAAGVVTTFTVDSLSDNQSRVTIATTTRTNPGLKGWLEKLTTPPIARRIYREELDQLAAVLQSEK